ncbi:MAG: hypothetical protein AAFR28_04150 [Pseudomonadota bacterium]
MSEDNASRTAPDAPKHEHVLLSKRLVAINAASAVIARVLNVTVLLWMYQYLLARITPEEFAVYPVLTAVMIFAPLFFTLFTGGVARYVVDAYARGEPERVTQIASSIAPVIAGAGVLFCGAGLLLAGYVEHVLTITPSMVEPTRVMLVLLVVNYTLQMVLLPFTMGFHVRQRFVEFNALGIVRDLLRMALLLMFLVGIGPSVFWVVVAAVISEQLHLAGVVYRSTQLVPEIRFRPRLFDWRAAKELVSFGGWTSLGQLSNLLYINGATLILNAHGTALDVTNFHMGATFFNQIRMMIRLAAEPLQPAMTAMHSLEDRKRLARTALRGGRYGLLVALLGATPLAIYSREFVQLYLGETFADAAIVLALFMIVFLATQPVTLLPMVALATARVRAYNLAALASTSIGFVTMIILAVYWDAGAIEIAATLVVVTLAVQVGYYWPLLFRLTGARLGDFVWEVLFRGLAPAVAGGVVWAGLAWIAPPESWLTLFLWGAIGGVVYLATAAVSSLETGEREGLKKLIDRFR